MRACIRSQLSFFLAEGLAFTFPLGWKSNLLCVFLLYCLFFVMIEALSSTRLLVGEVKTTSAAYRPTLGND